MKVFGLQGSVYRFARVASRLTAQTSAIAAVRRDSLQRFDRARRDGLTAVQAAGAVGVPRSTLYRWRARIEPRSRRPHRFRSKSWPSDLVRAVERLRLDFPMWGRAKIRRGPQSLRPDRRSHHRPPGPTGRRPARAGAPPGTI